MPQFIPRQRKQKVQKRLVHHARNSEPELDSNAMEIVSSSKNEKEEKRRAMEVETRAQHPQMSSKKKKRLDKYIVMISSTD